MARHHDNREFDPDQFAAEVLGTTTELQLRWYNREIDWRQKLVDTYGAELDLLESSRDELRRSIDKGKEETGPNPVVGNEVLDADADDDEL